MPRLKGFQKLASVDEALDIFLRRLKPELSTVSIPLAQASRRVLAQDVVACNDLPRTDRSAVDGYAVNAEETEDATQSDPKCFRITKHVRLTRGQTKRVWTGNNLPEGADAVVMLENAEDSEGKIEVWSSVAKWENVSRRGEDFREGEIGVESGTRIKPQHLGLMAALGISEVEVFRAPVVAVLATGNELAELGKPLHEAQVFDSNRPALIASCNELGAETLNLGIASDDLGEIARKLGLGLKKADAVFTSGGTSVGGSDLVPDAVNSLGRPGILVHGVAMRPGMPTALAIVEDKPIVILPGNPVAALLSFEVFGRPVICRLLGLSHAELSPTLRAKITRKVATTLGRKNLVRVHVSNVNNQFLAEPISARGSSLLSTMTKANGYVVVPENVEGLEKGDDVLVFMFDTIEQV